VTESVGPPARRAKLELLVRGEDPESFELREVSSAAAWIQMRPQRVAASEYELAEVTSRVDRQPRFILKNARTERYLMLTEPERFLWERMDGRTSLQDLATAYVLRYGQFDFDVIPVLIRKLQRAQLLTLTPGSRLRRALARNRRRRILQTAEIALTALERINFSSRRVHPLFEGLYRWGGFLLFTPVALVACVALAAIGSVAGVRLWQDADAVAKGLGQHPIGAILLVKLLFFGTVALHQIVHALALVHYGRRVREFGFTFLHGFVPTFYVDVTDIFMATRRARIVTAISGTLVHLVIGTLWLVVALRSSDPFVQAFAAASGVIQWQAFVIALYPFCFIEMDGYHVLVDVLGLPTLKHDALAYVGSLFRGSPLVRWGPEAGVFVFYVALSAVSVAAFVAFNIWMVLHATT
jgi:putative peptide zinc metalloprotease protein